MCKLLGMLLCVCCWIHIDFFAIANVECSLETKSLLAAQREEKLSDVAHEDEAGDDAAKRARFVARSAQQVMRENAIPGMAVGIVAHGKREMYYYGVASRKTAQAIDAQTLFEIGSVSKVFTGILGGYAQAQGKLSLADTVDRYCSELVGTPLGRVSLMALGTYIAGGLPLHFPATVTTRETMLRYLREWRPAFLPETHRQYSNPSVGLFGYLIAQALGESFESVMENTLFRLLQLEHTCINVPQAALGRYAQGYSKQGKPARSTQGMLTAEAYGVKTVLPDMLRFLEANLDASSLNHEMQQAIRTSQTGIYSVAPMTQGLGWEMYAYPFSIDTVIGQAERLPFAAQKTAAPMSLPADVFLHKTGSTNGFGTYVALVPSKKAGIVILANKNYPTAARIRMAVSLLEHVLEEN